MNTNPDQPDLTLRLLGPVDIRLGDTSVTSDLQNKMLVLLAYLAVERRPFSREHLSELLWPELAPDAARSNLRVTLYRLGQALGDNKQFLHTPRDMVSLVADRCRLDVADFLAPADGDAAADAMAARLSLYRGELIEGLSFEAIPDFADWLRVKRDSCHRHAMTILDRLISTLERKLDFKSALRYAHRYLELDPWSEHGHRTLMSLLAQDGQEAAALTQYDACKALLARELGAAPAAQTTALYEKIKAGKLRPEVAKPYRLPFLDQTPAPAPLGPLNVLIVDDHLLFRVGLTLMIEALGPEVTVFEAASGEAALALPAPARGFDLILLDYRLPGMSGLDALRRFRERHPATPVMLCSAEEDTAVIRAAADGGAAGYIGKAMDATTTITAIRKVLPPPAIARRLRRRRPAPPRPPVASGAARTAR